MNHDVIEATLPKLSAKQEPLNAEALSKVKGGLDFTLDFWCVWDEENRKIISSMKCTSIKELIDELNDDGLFEESSHYFSDLPDPDADMGGCFGDSEWGNFVAALVMGKWSVRRFKVNLEPQPMR